MHRVAYNLQGKKESGVRKRGIALFGYENVCLVTTKSIAFLFAVRPHVNHLRARLQYSNRSRADTRGGATIGAGRDMSPHFCGMSPAGGTTQFTLYTCGVLLPAAKVTQFTFGFSTWKFCFLFLYSLLLVIQSRKLGS